MVRLVRRLRVEIAAVLVIGVDVAGELQSLLFVIGDEQTHGFRTALDTSCRIDTRTELEDEVGHAHALALDTRHMHDGFHTHGWHGVECPQTVESQNPVLARHGDDVAGYAHR